MKKNRDMVVNAAVYLVFILLACVFSRLFAGMGTKLVNKFVELDFLADAWIRTVLLALFAFFFSLFLSYKYGYQTADFDLGETLPAALIGAAAHFLLGFVTVFSPLVSGAVKYVGCLVAYGGNYMSDMQTKNLPTLTLALSGLLFMLLYAGLVVHGTYLGTKKRLEDRAELLGEKGEEEK